MSPVRTAGCSQIRKLLLDKPNLDRFALRDLRRPNEIGQPERSRTPEIRSGHRLQLGQCPPVRFRIARTRAIGWSVNIESPHVRVMGSDGDAAVGRQSGQNQRHHL